MLACSLICPELVACLSWPQRWMRSAQQLVATDSQQAVQLLLLQPLPSGVYADPYELASWQADLPQHLQPTTAQLFGPVDLESAQPAARPQLVSLSAPASPGCSRPACTATKQMLSVPVHARYHLPVWPTDSSWAAQLGGPRALVELQQPRLLVQAGSRALWLCLQPDSPALSVLWDVPAGNLQHATLISWLTLVVVTFGGFVCMAGMLPASSGITR